MNGTPTVSPHAAAEESSANRIATERSVAVSKGRNRARTARWPLGVSLMLLWTSIGVLLAVSLQRTAGHIVYALDDPYIHMAMARNLAEHGVWGVTAAGFSSSSSSLLWTALLGVLFWVFGIREVIPFAANVVFATLTLVVVFVMLSRRLPNAPPTMLLVAMTFLTFATPLPTLVFIGQEHVLHVLGTIVFVFLAVDLLTGPRLPVRSRRFGAIAALGALLVLVRYEGLYPVVATAVLLAARRRVHESGTLLACVAAPLAVYAAISIGHGWWWAPNSVLLKGNVPDWKSAEGILNQLGYSAYTSLLTLPAAGFLIFGALVLLVWRVRSGFWDKVPLLLAMFVSIALMHLQYSQPKAFWLFRYEAHVIALGIVVCAAALLDGRLQSDFAGASNGARRAAGLALGLLLIISPLSDRAIKSAVRVSGAAANIYEQQYQMGRFLREFYPGQPVALNDIGAPSYLAGIQVMDLVGLASMDVATLRRTGTYSPSMIDDLARDRGVRIAIVYDHWFRNRLPRGWLRAGSWTIGNQVVAGGDTVTFYATRPEEYGTLISHLRTFEPALPAGVTSIIVR